MDTIISKMTHSTSLLEKNRAHYNKRNSTEHIMFRYST